MRRLIYLLSVIMLWSAAPAQAQLGDEPRPRPIRSQMAAMVVAREDTVRVCSTSAVCQTTIRVVTPAPVVPMAYQKTPNAEVLNQAQVALTSGAPKVSVQALKYYLGTGDDSKPLPFVILAALPALSDTSRKGVSERLLDEFGGLLNLAFVVQPRAVHPFGWLKFENQYLGLFYELRAGTRFVENEGVGVSTSRLNGLASTVGSVRLALPIWADPEQTTRAGSLGTSVSWSGNYSYSGDYAAAEPGSRYFAHVNLAGVFNITDLFFFSGGTTLTATAKNLEKRKFVSFSFRKN